MTAEVLEAAFQAHPEAKAALVTSPTYYGVLSDVDELGKICRSHGARLLVDGAHGAHLPLVLPREPNCLLGHNPYQGADGVAVSAHKTPARPGADRSGFRQWGGHPGAAPGGGAHRHKLPLAL